MLRQIPGVRVFNFDDCEVCLDVRKPSALALRVVSLAGDIRPIQHLDDVNPQELGRFCDAVLANALPAKFACRKELRTFLWVAEVWRPRKYTAGQELVGVFRQGIGPFMFTQRRFTVMAHVIGEFRACVLAAIEGNQKRATNDA